MTEIPLHYLLAEVKFDSSFMEFADYSYVYSPTVDMWVVKTRVMSYIAYRCDYVNWLGDWQGYGVNYAVTYD